MAEHTSRPVVYILHGEDEQARAEIVGQMRQRLAEQGEAVLEMNYLRLEGPVGWNALREALFAMPFLAERRVVHWLRPPLADRTLAKRLPTLLEQIPPTTAFVLEVPQTLPPKHWLLAWARSYPERAWVKETGRPEDMAAWVLKQARKEGGMFTPAAAQALAEQVGDDTLVALQEIRKLLAYVGYRRPVEPDDVLALTAVEAHPNIFHMVDAVGRGDGRLALRLLQQLLEREDQRKVWGMLIRQFRLLLLAREALDERRPLDAVARMVGVPPFAMRKAAEQARRFTLQDLERLYRHLLLWDMRMKTGEAEWPTAMYMLIGAVTAR